METRIEEFKMYAQSHPNLSRCWINYLELKKRHYDGRAAEILNQSSAVLNWCEKGCSDFEENDIIRILLYKRSV
jgi:hypothetical protein